MMTRASDLGAGGSLDALRADLAAGRTTSRALVETCLDRAGTGEGPRVYLRVDADAARFAADAADRLRREGVEPSPYAGIPISVKDLFDIGGQITTAGSRVLADAAPAACDAGAVARLKAAGFVVIGRTQMTEFAYSGLGLNPHDRAPANPFDREVGRIPGGSSSGAAVSVTDGMAAAGLGTDTGGSCRIPAALTGLVGFKPTASRMPSEGVFPLSTSLDSVGTLAPTVTCCAMLDRVLAGEALRPLAGISLRRLRIGVPQTVVLDGLDAHVAAAFSRALTRLSGAGAQIIDLPMTEFAELAAINAKGGLAAAEAYALHAALLAARGDEYDPRVRVRIEKGASHTAAEYLAVQAARRDWIMRVSRRIDSVDVLVCPTVPTIAPTFAELEDDDAFGRINLAMLRNPTFANFLDGCSVSIPCHRAGDAPVGLMLMQRGGQDERVLSIARAMEAALTAHGD